MKLSAFGSVLNGRGSLKEAFRKSCFLLQDLGTDPYSEMQLEVSVTH